MLITNVEYPIRLFHTERDMQVALLEEKLPAKERTTVLAVDDDPMLVRMVKIMLEELGYQALAADTPGKAIKLAEEHANEIKLFLTDVIMPEMNGPDLAERIKPLCPGIKILFMSGYPANLISHKSLLNEGVSFMQKPFSFEDLSVKVWEAVSKK